MTDPTGPVDTGDEPDPDDGSLYVRESSGAGLIVVLAIVALLVAVVIGVPGFPSEPAGRQGDNADAAPTTSTTTIPTTSTTATPTTTTPTTTTPTTSTTTPATSTTVAAPPPATVVSVGDIDAAVAGYINDRLPGWTITYLGSRPDITGWADTGSRILYVYVRPDRSAADHAAVIRHQIDVLAASST